jgi:hypothetical protein
MGSLSDYAKGKLLDHIFNASYTASAHIYLCLCTADPTDAGTGASMHEHPNLAGYARTEIFFGAASARRITQNAEVEFPAATDAYTTITHWAICDSGTYGAGNMLAHGGFTPTFSPVSGNTPKVASGQVYVEIGATAAGAGFSTYCVNLMLDLMFRNQEFTSPAGNTFVAIYTATIADADDDTTDKAEENGTGYARTEVNQNGGSSPTWDLAASEVVDNTHEIILEDSVNVADDWDTDVALAVVSTASGAGKIYCYDNANVVDQRPRVGDQVRVAAGAFDVSLS